MNPIIEYHLIQFHETLFEESDSRYQSKLNSKKRWIWCATFAVWRRPSCFVPQLMELIGLQPFTCILVWWRKSHANLISSSEANLVALSHLIFTVLLFFIFLNSTELIDEIWWIKSFPLSPPIRNYKKKTCQKRNENCFVFPPVKVTNEVGKEMNKQLRLMDISFSF